MTTPDEFIKYNAETSFAKIFTHKGEIAPISEKASRNLELKIKNKVGVETSVHYFAVGHAFKQIDKEAVFDYVYDEETDSKIPYRFTSLIQFDMQFCDELKDIISNIRNLNSHYIHDFEKIKFDTPQKKMLTFIRESFELAVIQTYLKEKDGKISAKDFFEDKEKTNDKELSKFLSKNFYPIDNEKKKEDYYQKYLQNAEYFKTLSKDQAIETILFSKVNSEFDWMLHDTHKAFSISTGEYLTYHACLFLLSMFLYKHEAEQLISKIKGFKKNKKEDKPKRDIFTFFSKKFSSEDIKSEQAHLVKFRDIVQYLNHYPLPWKKDMELESEHPLMTDKLKAKIIEMEINRSYPIFAGNARFHTYIKYQLWGKKHFGNRIIKEYCDCSFTPNEIDQFNYEIDTCGKVKDAETKLKDKHLLKHDEIKQFEKRIEENKNTPNNITQTLKTRIDKNLLFTSYGRNIDRFMQFATRYLAETNYFGKNAQFKMYRFFSSKDNTNEIESLKEKLDKKQYDNLKFHDGRLTHFTTYKEHLERYESWDTPFVEENNAVQVQITLNYEETLEGTNQTILVYISKVVSIQRSLMIYILEDALKSDMPENGTSAGEKLLLYYYLHHKKEFIVKKQHIENNEKNEIEVKDKKIFPKRLINQFVAVNQKSPNQKTAFEMIFEKAKKSEERNKDLLSKAKKDGRLDDFKKRNKGKQFKLQFIRKAWHYMYLRETYSASAADGKHHKQYHITRDEFNDFCRYMFAFDEVPQYKNLLKELLHKKHFLDNIEFATLLENGKNLDDLYFKTKEKFKVWMSQPKTKNDRIEHFTLAQYEKFFADKMFYINLSHFRDFLIKKEKFSTVDNKIDFKSLENNQYLMQEYYYADTLAKEEYKTNDKLFNELRKSRLEDALLYELAMHYFGMEKEISTKARTPVQKILSQDVAFEIMNLKDNCKYTLNIPFKKLESYIGLNSSLNLKDFLTRLVAYLKKTKSIDGKNDGGYVNVCNKIIESPTITLNDLFEIEKHIVENSIKFTRVAIGMEEYFVCDKVETLYLAYKANNYKEKSFFVNWKKTGIPEDFFTLKDEEGKVILDHRNNAFHFDIPEEYYPTLLKKILKDFMIMEKIPQTAETRNKKQEKIHRAFINSIYK